MQLWLDHRTQTRALLPRIPQILSLVVTAALVVVFAAQTAFAYNVAAGSSDNLLQLQLDERSGALAGLTLDVAATSSADWIQVLDASVLEGRVREVDIRFAVSDQTPPGSVGSIEVTLSTPGEEFNQSRRIPLAVAASVDPIQQSYEVLDCCLPTTGVGPGGATTESVLLGVTPNPVSSGLAHVVFELGTGGKVSLELHDVQGRLLRTLETPYLPSGFHRITWDGRDQSGRDLPPGVYFYTIRSGDWSATRKLQLLR
jgi:hypothetical protein